jgi:non-specific serine/threonine protein kinase/serine/threonine-protein kinase
MQTPGAAPDAFIGPYRLVRQLGEGGMGVVYYAQQLQPIRREVALKIIKPGMDSKQVIARFESERQALAVLDHPNIARVFDAGTTAAGLPYFVMEMVDGVPITRYCDSKYLTVRERIELFIPVCRAIQHAHQKGIIHRDIKPSNILVAEPEGRPTPKVIDFGLAKALGQQLSDATIMMNLGTVLGTLDYMSPEQAELTRHDIDTRSDVYSLGAVLYELFTGTTPLDSEHLAKAGYPGALQLIREEAPAPPSTRLRGSTPAAEVAARRHSDLGRLPKLLHGEIDWIVLQALNKDRRLRYETVNGLARDLERYLNGEPLEAGPPSTVYRIRKLVQKYRVWLAVAAAFIIMLVAGVVVSTWMAIRASRAEAEARAVNDFIQNDLLAQAGASNQSQGGTKPDPHLEVRTALDRAAAKIAGKFQRQPLVEASIRQTIGNTYMDLGLYSEAERQFQRALELRQRFLGENGADTLLSLSSVAGVLEREGRLAKAEPLYTKVLEMQRRALGEEHPNTLSTRSSLAATYAGQAIAGDWAVGNYMRAEEIYTRLIPVQRRVLGEDHPRTLVSMGNLAAIYENQHKYALAEPLFIKTLEIERRALGDEHPDSLRTMSNLAELYRMQGDNVKAQPLYVRALEGERRVLGDRHRYTIFTMNGLAMLYRTDGDYGGAETLYAQALEGARQGLGEEHPRTLESMTGLAFTYGKERKYTKAEALYARALELRQKVLGREHPMTLSTMIDLGWVWVEQNKNTRAESTFRDVLRSYEKSGADEWNRYYCKSLLGASLAGQKRYAEAEPLLLSGYHGLKQRQAAIEAEDRFVLAESGERIVTLYRAWGKPAQAAEWQSKLQVRESPAQ